VKPPKSVWVSMCVQCGAVDCVEKTRTTLASNASYHCPWRYTGCMGTTMPVRYVLSEVTS
jgi:hypothetical protein